jgi:putative tryptophan/tyrosine transport system substrate-binding protein
LRPGSPPDPYVDAFRQGLRDLGYVERQTIALEYRWAEGRSERFPSLAAELVKLKVDVIVTQGEESARAVKQATSTIPIVMATSADPVEAGLVASLGRPGGNVTGLSAVQPDVIRKPLQLLKETVPKLSRVAILSVPGNLTMARSVKEAQEADVGIDGSAPRYASP